MLVTCPWADSPLCLPLMFWGDGCVRPPVQPGRRPTSPRTTRRRSRSLCLHPRPHWHGSGSEPRRWTRPQIYCHLWTWLRAHGKGVRCTTVKIWRREQQVNTYCSGSGSFITLYWLYYYPAVIVSLTKTIHRFLLPSDSHQIWFRHKQSPIDAFQAITVGDKGNFLFQLIRMCVGTMQQTGHRLSAQTSFILWNTCWHELTAATR